MSKNSDLKIFQPSVKTPSKEEIRPLRNVHKALGLQKLKSNRNRRWMKTDLVLGSLASISLASFYMQNPLGVLEGQILNNVVNYAFEVNNMLLVNVAIGATIYGAPAVIAGCFVASFFHCRRSNIIKRKEANKKLNKLLKYHIWSNPEKYIEKGALALKSEFIAPELSLDDAKEIVSRQALRHAQDRASWGYKLQKRILSAESDIVQDEIWQKVGAERERMEKERARVEAEKKAEALASDPFKGEKTEIPVIDLTLDAKNEAKPEKKKINNKEYDVYDDIVIGYAPNEAEFESEQQR